MKAITTTTITTKEVSVRCTKAWGFCPAGNVYKAILTIYNTHGSIIIQGLPRATQHPSLFTDTQGEPTAWNNRFELVA